MTSTTQSVNSLHELQKAMKPILKDQTNTHFKNAYYDINSLIEKLKPELERLKLTIIQPVKFLDGKNVLVTKLIDENEKELVESSIALPDNLDPQKMGSAITYYRRYSLASMLLLQAEDDDGNSTLPTASKVPSQLVRQAPQSTSPAPQGESEVTITSYKEYPKKGNNGPYWSVAIGTQEYGEASCLIYEEEFLPKFRIGEKRKLRFTQNGKYLNWSFPQNPYDSGQ